MVLFYTIFFFSFFPSGLVAAADWSITVPDTVNQYVGEDAILPCIFTTPYTNYKDIITVMWRIKYPFKGPVIFQCVSKGKESENGQNCTESFGRYSLIGNPRTNNIILRIQNVSFSDNTQYFCRFELRKSGDNYEIDTGTSLNIQVPPALKSIYIQTLPSGEQFVTCVVSGRPPPTVTWITPEITNASQVSVQTDWTRASSSIPVNQSNTNYTCQIQGENGQKLLSIYHQKHSEQEPQIPFTLFIIFVILSGVFFIISVILIVIYKSGSSKSLAAAQQVNFSKRGPVDTKEAIYANV